MGEEPNNSGNEFTGDWSPVNGRAPYWLKVTIWAVQRGVLFNLVGMGAMLLMSLAYVGVIKNPQLDAFTVAHVSQSQEIGQARQAAERAVNWLEINNKEIIHYGKDTKLASEKIAKGIAVLCLNDAEKTNRREDDDRCKELYLSR